MGGRLAITGANGLIGRRLTADATSAGWDVAGLVRSSAGARAVTEAGGRAIPVPALERAHLTAAFAGADAVVHLAQVGAERGADTYESVNVLGTREVVQAARAAAVPLVVLFSGLGVAHYGMKRRTTNPYFLSKLASELETFRSGVAAVVFRPSYIVGGGDGLMRALLPELASGPVEVPGDGGYRLQPIALRDAVASVLAVADRPAPLAASAPAHHVFDLVGPEALSYRALIERVAHVRNGPAALGALRIREAPVEEADRQARSGGGYRGMLSDELDCLLCDEVSDPQPLAALLGRKLTPLDQALAEAVSAATRS